MTIALGLLAQDGLILAADTQETIPGFWKNDQGKIMSAGHTVDAALPDVGYCLLAGAGHGSYVDALGRQIITRFNGSPDVAVLADVEPTFGPLIESFHANTFFRFRSIRAMTDPSFDS